MTQALKERADERRISFRPKAGSMRSRDQHWARMDQLRGDHGLPAYAFDFISVHKSSFETAEPYSLCSPLFLVHASGKRPIWEQETFALKSDVVRRARALARLHDTYVVDCTDT